MHSESCVLVLLTAWVNSRERPACSSQQLEQLVAGVRVTHLSSLHLHHVLPRLHWFRDHCPGMEHHLATILLLQQAVSTTPAIIREGGSEWGGPAGWIASRRSRTHMPISTPITIALGLEELRRIDRLEAASPGSSTVSHFASGLVYLNGVFFRVCGSKHGLVGTASITASKGPVTLGLYLAVDGALMEQLLGFCWDQTQPLDVEAAEMWVSGQFGACKISAGHLTTTTGTGGGERACFGSCNFLGGQQHVASVEELAASFMVDGRLAFTTFVYQKGA